MNIEDRVKFLEQALQEVGQHFTATQWTDEMFLEDAEDYGREFDSPEEARAYVENERAEMYPYGDATVTQRPGSDNYLDAPAFAAWLREKEGKTNA